MHPTLVPRFRLLSLPSTFATSPESTERASKSPIVNSCMDEEIEKLQQELEKLENLVDDKSEDRKNLESEFDKILKMTNMQSYFPNF